VALGPVSGLVGVDIDGDDGERALRDMAGGELAATLEFRSGGGGRRLLYAIPAGVQLRPTHQAGGERHSGYSLLGYGSQTVMPPSRHASGGRYAWVRGRGPEDIDPAPAPAWLLALMAPTANGRPSKATAKILAEGEPIREGGRNTTLTSLAGSMRRRGMSHAAILAALLAENEARCDPPLDDAEVEAIAGSVARYPPAAPTPSANGQGHVGCGASPAAVTQRRPAAAIILEHLRAVYQPAFRRADRVWSAAMHAEVRRGEAMARASDTCLMDALAAEAREVPRDDDGQAKRTQLPRVYRDWFPVAWADLLAGLPDEPEAEEVEASAEEDFRRRLAGALTGIVTLGFKHDGASEPDREARSILHWCLLFARPGRWAQVRSYFVWCRLEGDGSDRHESMRVAIRADLLGQLGMRDLAEMGQDRLADLAERYGVGRRCRAGRGGKHAIALEPAWVCDLLDSPQDGEGDAVNAPRACACVEKGVTPSPEGPSP
jgi:hypothetical protein